MDSQPKILIPLPITRQFIREHRERIFLYGNRWGDTSFIGKQSSICAGFDNCFYIPVRWNCCKSSGWFDDSESALDNVKRRFEHLHKLLHNATVIPFPKIGRGQWANLQNHAPKILAYIEEEIKKLAYPNIEYVYSYV